MERKKKIMVFHLAIICNVNFQNFCVRGLKKTFFVVQQTVTAFIITLEAFKQEQLYHLDAAKYLKVQKDVAVSEGANMPLITRNRKRSELFN